MESFFNLEKNKTNIRTEILAGITTFMAMCYILFVNAGMFATLPDVSYEGMYIATALSACIGSLLIGLLANLPLAQASGMGLNAYFVYTVCLGLGFTYANALVMVLLDGIMFTLLTEKGRSLPPSIMSSRTNFPRCMPWKGMGKQNSRPDSRPRSKKRIWSWRPFPC